MSLGILSAIKLMILNITERKHGVAWKIIAQPPFYCTLLTKEPVTPIKTAIAICLMVSFAVHVFKDIRT